MCGIWFFHTRSANRNLTDVDLFNAFMAVKPRGPDNTDYKILDKYSTIIGFHRLAINGLTKNSANQPFVYDTEHSITYVICNGEIYNFKQLSAKYDIPLESGSDCEVIYPLYTKIGMKQLMDEIDGEFAMIIIELNKITGDVKISVGRDQMGIRPLYIAVTDKEICITSVQQGLPKLQGVVTENPRIIGCGKKVQQFPARSYLEMVLTYNYMQPSVKKYYHIRQIPQTITDRKYALDVIQKGLIESVELCMICDREFATSLSGGLDSSLVSAISSRIQKSRGKRLTTFCIGMCDGSPDIVWANKVAKYIDSNHITVIIPEHVWVIVLIFDHIKKELSEPDPAKQHAIRKIEELYKCNVLETIAEYGLTKSISDVTRTYDITTLRASTGQYLLAKWIAMHYPEIKVLLIGDGSDELTGGYQYMLKAPSSTEFHEEILNLLNKLINFDVLRPDRCIADNGIESRVPFLQKKFMTSYLSIAASIRMPDNGLEKSLLRDAFADTDLLPPDALYRRKEAFSDGVSVHDRSLFTIVKEIFDIVQIPLSSTIYVHNPPPTKEARYYRDTYTSLTGDDDEMTQILPCFWLPKWLPKSSQNAYEPSARALDHYTHTQLS